MRGFLQRSPPVLETWNSAHRRSRLRSSLYPSICHRFKNTDKVASFVERAFHPAVTDQADLHARSASAQVGNQKVEDGVTYTSLMHVSIDSCLVPKTIPCSPAQFTAAPLHWRTTLGPFLLDFPHVTVHTQPILLYFSHVAQSTLISSNVSSNPRCCNRQASPMPLICVKTCPSKALVCVHELAI